MVQTEVTACSVPLLGRPANLHPPSAQPGRPSSGTRRRCHPKSLVLEPCQVIDLAHEFTGLIEAVLSKSQVDPGTLHVSPTRIGGILIEWQDDAMEHEVELNPDCSVGFLHLHKATGEIQTRKFSPGTQAVVDPGLLHELRQLVAA